MIRKLAALAAVLAPLSFVSADTKSPAILYESMRQQAIRMNTLAGNLDTPEDARALVGMFASEFRWSGRLGSRAFLRHFAQVEFDAAHDPAHGISEQQVAEAWNTYMQEIAAAPETRITAAEFHSIRDAHFASARYLFWRPGRETVFAMPALYNTQPGESLAPNCRPLEILVNLFSLQSSFENLTAARERVRKGMIFSDEIRKSLLSPAAHQSVGVVRFRVIPPNPITEAERLYAAQHGNRQLRAAQERLAENLLAGH